VDEHPVADLGLRHERQAGPEPVPADVNDADGVFLRDDSTWNGKTHRVTSYAAAENALAGKPPVAPARRLNLL
jgi:hypothetical protein